MKFTNYFISFLVLSFSTTSLTQTSFGSAVDFDGYGDYAYTLNNPYFPTPDGTLEAWVKVRSIIPPGYLDDIGEAFISKNEEQWNQGDFYIFFWFSNGKLSARIQNYPSYQTDVFSNNSFFQYLDIWFHVAFSWGSDGMKMYLNEVLQNDQNNIIHSALNNTYNFYVGAHGYMLHNGTYVVTDFFDGQIDELRIWNYQKTGDVRDFSVLQNHLDLVGDAHLVPSNVVIPVELVSFTADVNANQVRLQWETSSELNNLGFEIERKSEISDWKTIGFKEGKGTTTEFQRYTYIDDLFGISSDNFSYRLKQLDFDGTFSYSEEMEVELNPTFFELFQNYPNPFNPNTIISWQLPESKFVTLKIYDVLGNEVASPINEEKPAGIFEVEFNATALSSGVYFYSLQAGEFFDVKKMLLIK